MEKLTALMREPLTLAAAVGIANFKSFFRFRKCGQSRVSCLENNSGKSFFVLQNYPV
jgi:hypothetical protein